MRRREAEMGDKILLKRLESLPENLSSSPTPKLTPYSPFFANFLSALFYPLPVLGTHGAREDPGS